MLRKGLPLLMLVKAPGTASVATVLSSTQIAVFTIFNTFYVPCLATLVGLAKEIRKNMKALASVHTFVPATLLGVTARLLLPPILVG